MKYENWKRLPLPVPLELKTRLKVKAAQENTPYSMILKKLMLGYVTGKIKMPEFSEDEISSIKTPWLHK